MNENIREIRLTKRAKYGLITMASVAIIGVGLATTLSNLNTESNNTVVNNIIEDNSPSEEVPVVVVEEEKFAKPFSVNAITRTYYFDIDDQSVNQENALIYYNGMYSPSTEIDYSYNNVQFEVQAVFDGVVTDKRVDPLYGSMVYLKSVNNPSLVVVYSSLSDVNVKVGDTIKQGETIARAGNNTIGSNLGNHLSFSLLKDGKYVNPDKYYSKEVKSL